VFELLLDKTQYQDDEIMDLDQIGYYNQICLLYNHTKSSRITIYDQFYIGNFLTVSEKFRQNLRIDTKKIRVIDQTIGNSRNILPN